MTRILKITGMTLAMGLASAALAQQVADPGQGAARKDVRGAEPEPAGAQ